MDLKILYTCILIILSPIVGAQTDQTLNQTDSQGRKQGHWVKQYPNGNIMYDGYFLNDKPTGEFKRYYENKSIKSVLVFNKAGNEAIATLYYQNGLTASKGKYVNQLKEGKWQFFSPSNKDVLISEEVYLKDKKNGLQIKYYPDSTIAEKLSYVNDKKNGEWLKYYLNGTMSLRTYYRNDKLDGKFEAFFEDGKPELTGQYKNDIREGLWIIYRNDGSQRFKTNYTVGIADNRDMEIYETNYLDSLEQNMKKIPDPEKTGKIW